MAQRYDNDDEVCVQCGRCCKIYGDRISPTITDLYLWMVNGKKEILRYFTAFYHDGTCKNCASLEPADLGDFVSVEMRDPDSNEYLTVCPFLRRVTETKYICSIHAIKPEMCCNFMPWERRQTDFALCRALKNEPVKSRRSSNRHQVKGDLPFIKIE